MIKMIGRIFFLIVVLSFLVSGWGPSYPYWDENPLYVGQGDSEIVVITLQNMVGGEDIVVKVETESEIASIGGYDYEVPFGRKDIEVPIEVKIPRKASIGDRYDVSLSFRQFFVEDGMVSVAGKIVKSFPVIVVEPTKDWGVLGRFFDDLKESYGFSIFNFREWGFLSKIFICAVLVSILFFVWHLLKKRKRKNHFPRKSFLTSFKYLVRRFFAWGTKRR